jgi:hypothetical protein
MQTLLSGLFGAVLVALIYGLTFIPSATLDQSEEEQVLGSDAQEGLSAENRVRAGIHRNRADRARDAI